MAYIITPPAEINLRLHIHERFKLFAWEQQISVAGQYDQKFVMQHLKNALTESEVHKMLIKIKLNK